MKKDRKDIKLSTYVVELTSHLYLVNWQIYLEALRVWSVVLKEFMLKSHYDKSIINCYALVNGILY